MVKTRPYKTLGIVTDALISARFISKTIETQKKWVYVTGHLILPKNAVQRIPGQFVNKTRTFSHQKKNIFI